MAFSEFYCDAASGDNLAAGSSTGSPVFTFTSGNWTQATRVFTASGADLSGVTTDMYASVYADGASAPTGYVAKITAVDDGADTITLSATILAGTAPTNGTGNRTIKVGGAWLGPNAAVDFPFDFSGLSALESAASTPVRVNLKNGTDYAITAQIVPGTGASAVRFQGYTTTAGDGGYAVINGGTTGASYTLWNQSTSTAPHLSYIEFKNNGATGNTTAIVITGGSLTLDHVVLRDIRGKGIVMTTGSVHIAHCELYGWNQAANADGAGIETSTNAIITCSVIHDPTGATSNGIYVKAGTCEINTTIVDSCTSNGILVSASSSTCHVNIEHCEIYNNTDDGIDLSNSSSQVTLAKIMNCNLVKNGGWGINGSGNARRSGYVENCGFGGGASANTSGTTTGLKGMIETGSVNYTTHPWQDPANGVFTIIDSAAKNTGHGEFVQTAAGYGDTVGYPDIGAAQHLDSGGSANAQFLHNRGNAY